VARQDGPVRERTAPDAQHEGQGGEPSVAHSPLGWEPSARVRRYLGGAAVAILLVALIAVALSGPDRLRGPAPGTKLPPFAVPLALGDLNGDANVAVRPHQGAAGARPACTVRGRAILNICQLYERGPVVLALFFDVASCPHFLGELQGLASSFPGVAFAAVAIKGERGPLRSLIAADHLTLPLGLDRGGALVPLYHVITCAQLDFVYPGGTVQSRALVTPPPAATLRARVSALVAAAEARGWRRPSSLPAASTG
jgi:hypothetical protein